MNCATKTYNCSDCSLTNHGRNCNNHLIVTNQEMMQRAKLYAPVIPQGSAYCGIIHDGARKGAVIRLGNGAMVQCNAGLIRPL